MEKKKIKKQHLLCHLEIWWEIPEEMAERVGGGCFEGGENKNGAWKDR